MTFDDDAAFLRNRLGAADPAGSPPLSGDVHAARAELRNRLDNPVDAVVSNLAPASRSRRRVWRVAAPLAAAAALVVGVVATQSFSSHEPVAGAAVALAAADATQQAETSRAAFNVTYGDQAVSGEGVADLAKSTAHFNLHLPPQIGDVEVIIGGADIYVSTPSLAKPLVGGKPWLHVDRPSLDELSQSAGGNSLLSSGMLDPASVLTYLRAVSNDLAKVGTEDVRGTSTTHYAGHIDPNRLAAQIPDQNARDELTKLAQKANQSVPVDIWVDDQSRLRKLTVSFDLSKVQTDKPTADLSGTVSATIELWDFGASVDTTSPPADQVSDIKPILDLLQKFHR